MCSCLHVFLFYMKVSERHKRLLGGTGGLELVNKTQSRSDAGSVCVCVRASAGLDMAECVCGVLPQVSVSGGSSRLLPQTCRNVSAGFLRGS